MELRKASRKKAKIRLGLQGPSGSGKTYSSLLLAFGLCGDYSKIAVIDTEANSADLYAHLGPYNVLNISEPFSPEKYIEAILICEKAGTEVIILDSVSPEWDGTGGILDIHGKMAGNSFANWSKVKPRHNGFVNAILNSSAHIIATLRTKHDYVLNEKNGKNVVEKIGLKAIQRENLEYELTLVFDLDIKNFAVSSKDRTGLFFGKAEQKLTAEAGAKILQWCNEGIEPLNEVEILMKKIEAASTVDELIDLFKSNLSLQEQMLPHFTRKRNQLGVTNPIFDKPKTSSNGRVSIK